MNGMNKHRWLGIAVLVGLSTFCIEMGHFLHKIQTWEVAWNPPSIGDMLIAAGSALGSVTASLGINLDKLRGASPTPAPPVEGV